MTITTGPQGIIRSYTPVLQGATDNPTATYTTQVGSYALMGKICKVGISIVTSSITKTTLTDSIRVSLPFPSSGTANLTQMISAYGSNSTPVQSANSAYITSGNSYVTLSQIALTALIADLTYALVTGIGVLTNTITININGVYEIA